MSYVTLFDSPNVIISHTFGIEPESDVSFQKSAWSLEQRAEKLNNAYDHCLENNISEDLAVVGFNPDSKIPYRVIDRPDADLFTKQDGNVLITTKNDISLMAWAADCCLVALVANNGEAIAVLHASVKTLKNGVVRDAICGINSLLGKPAKIKAFIGACAGACCYEYGKAQATDDFKDYPEHILPIDGNEDKVKLDLYGAVKQALEKADVECCDIFPPENRCTICAKDENGNYMFPSYRRDVVDGKHMNGQYGLFICKKNFK